MADIVNGEEHDPQPLEARVARLEKQVEGLISDLSRSPGWWLMYAYRMVRVTAATAQAGVRTFGARRGDRQHSRR